MERDFTVYLVLPIAERLCGMQQSCGRPIAAGTCLDALRAAAKAHARYEPMRFAVLMSDRFGKLLPLALWNERGRQVGDGYVLSQVAIGLPVLNECEKAVEQVCLMVAYSVN